jgi:hypothetical protein
MGGTVIHGPVSKKLLIARNAALHEINCIYSNFKLTKLEKYECYLLAVPLDTQQ